MFHSQVDPEDECAFDEGIGTDAGSRFQERPPKAVEIFEAYKDGRTFIHRVNLDILRSMCTDRGLPAIGRKIDLLTELKEWVSFVAFTPVGNLPERAHELPA